MKTGGGTARRLYPQEPLGLWGWGEAIFCKSCRLPPLCFSSVISLCLSLCFSPPLPLAVESVRFLDARMAETARRRCASLVLDDYWFDVLAEWNMLCILKLMLHVQHRVWLLGTIVLLSENTCNDKLRFAHVGLGSNFLTRSEPRLVCFSFSLASRSILCLYVSIRTTRFVTQPHFAL